MYAIRSYYDQTEIVAKGKWKEALRAYCANMAYADYNAGIVLDALAKSKYAKNTIVCFVITSYSIHYTKLYESRARHAGIELCQGAGSVVESGCQPRSERPSDGGIGRKIFGEENAVGEAGKQERGCVITSYSIHYTKLSTHR